jgi:hypothetical protein
MPITLNGDSGITTPTYGGAVTAEYIAPVTAFKNRIINGAMQIDQRNNGAAVTPTDVGIYTLDRWRVWEDTDGTATVQRSSVSTAGFTNSLLWTTTSADASLGTTQYAIIGQFIEGFNVADLSWGTANAQTVTLSFWVRSSLTGTFGGSIANGAGNRSYPFTYTISSANTYEYKTITIAGDTTGTWATDNTTGLRLYFGLGVGSAFSGAAGSWSGSLFLSATGATSVVGTNGATFYITGVQLEKGSTATSFDYRPYGTELALCQRYYYRITAPNILQAFSNAYSVSTTLADGVIPFPVSMRDSPTALEQTGTATNYNIRIGASDLVCSIVPNLAASNPINSWIRFTVASGLTLGQGVILRSGIANAFLAWSAEL